MDKGGRDEGGNVGSVVCRGVGCVDLCGEPERASEKEEEEREELGGGKRGGWIEGRLDRDLLFLDVAYGRIEWE